MCYIFENFQTLVRIVLLYTTPKTKIFHKGVILITVNNLKTNDSY